MQLINFLRKHANSLRDYATLITAIIALMAFFRPNLERLLFPGNINIYKIGVIELGCNYMGPIMKLRGSLIALNTEYVINNIKLKVTRADGEWNIFELDYFITGKMSINRTIHNEITKTQEEFHEWPYPFQLPTTRPHNYYMRFYDISVFNIIKNDYGKLVNNWRSLIYENKKINTNELYKRFKQSALYLEYSEELKKNFFWKEGDYLIDILVETSYGKIFNKKYSFKITKEHSKKIRNYIDGNLGAYFLNNQEIDILSINYD